MQLYQKIALGVFAFCAVVMVTRRVQQEQDAEALRTTKPTNPLEEYKRTAPQEHKYPPSLFSPEERAVIRKNDGCDLTLWNTPWSDRRTVLVFEGGEQVVWFGIGTPDMALIRYQKIEGYIDFPCVEREPAPKRRGSGTAAIPSTVAAPSHTGNGTLRAGSNRATSAPAVGLEGLYQSKDDDSRAYLKLYRDGLVIAVTVGGDLTPNEISDVERWFHRPYSDSGNYQVDGSAIQFSIQSQEGTVDYQGQIQGTELILDSYSHINGYRGHAAYHLITASR